MTLNVHNVKKAPREPDALARPTGLFIDPDARPGPADSRGVIDVPARAVPESAEAEAAPAARSPGFSGIRVTRPQPATVETAEPGAAKPGALGSLRQRFGSKPGAAGRVREEPRLAATPAPVDPAEAGTGAAAAANGQKAAKASRGAFGALGALGTLGAAKGGQTEKAEKTVKAKDKAPRRASGKAPNRVTLLVELDSGRQLYWSLGSDCLEQLSEAPATPLFSFSREDLRFGADGALSYKQASDLALREIGDSVQVVNRTRDLGAVYATRQERSLDARNVLIPAQQVMDLLLAKKLKEGASTICGFLLKDPQTELSVAVLYHIGPDGESSKPQLSVNPDSMEFVTAQFCANRKLDKNSTEILPLFDNAQFLSMAAEATPYPNERVWRGVPVRKLLWGAAFVSMALAVGASGWAAWQMQQAAAVRSEQAKLQGSIAHLKQSVGTRMQEALPDFVNAMTLDVRELATRGQQLWVPGSRLVLTADLANAKYELWLPVTKGDTFYNRPSALDSITADTHQALVNYQAPEGCTRDEFGVSGSMNETALTINCQTGNPALARYRND